MIFLNKLEKEITKRKNISIYPSTEEFLKKLSEKYKLSHSRIIDLAIQKFLDDEKDVI